ncbi:MAG: hypothetical protein HY795_14640 [Desulfovibrio sp.]|nr:hypothetical protein [Desulfovibrio sp.]
MRIIEHQKQIIPEGGLKLVQHHVDMPRKIGQSGIVPRQTREARLGKATKRMIGNAGMYGNKKLTRVRVFRGHLMPREIPANALEKLLYGGCLALPSLGFEEKYRLIVIVETGNIVNKALSKEKMLRPYLRIVVHI